MKKIADNRKARFKYAVEKTVTAGIVLVGSEVKSARGGHVRIDESYARIVNDEVFVYAMYIGEYAFAGADSHETERRRKLLLKRAEIVKLKTGLNQKGMTLVPLDMFFNDRSFVKVTLGLVHGKDHADRRQTIRKREAERQIRRAMYR
ncbi:MAG: SsrA-binding protein SmpB [Planctomycetota bacterium]